ncbi:MAG: DUF308 domain-containing protein [Bacilli bacterium]|nr:DUF308 domain-containing protein [Bacilli bacterium]
MKSDVGLSGILIGILYFVLGVVFFAATEELIRTFNYILVCICAIIGVIQLVQFFWGKKYQENNYTDLLLAVVFIWVSLILYVYYGFMINILPILFSLYLFVMACDMFVNFIKLKGSVAINRHKYLLLSIIALLIGLLLIFNPGSIIITYLKITGIYLILVSILYFMDFFKRVKK